MNSSPIIIIDYQKRWPGDFLQIGRLLRGSLRTVALRIDHIGSTAIEGLAAKDVIDIQVTIADLDEPAVPELIAATGAARIEGAQDHLPPAMTLEAAQLQKLLFVLEYPMRANIHVREQARFNQQYPLLCRDYLRAHAKAAAAYSEVKKQLARLVVEDAEAYYDVKDPVFDLIMSAAREWAKATNWIPGPSDA